MYGCDYEVQGRELMVGVEQVKALRDRGVKASAIFGTLGKKARTAVMDDLMGRLCKDGPEGLPPHARRVTLEILNACTLNPRLLPSHPGSLCKPYTYNQVLSLNLKP